MPFSLRSIALSSASIAVSSLVFGLAEPVVTPAPGPDELAVPALLMPGGGGAASLDALPAPLGSLPELFSPPAFAGPDGTPLTPDVPAPADPALGEPTALPLPAEGLLAAPPVLPPLALPPPALCAWAIMGRVKIAIAVIAAVTDVLVIGHLRLGDLTAAQDAGSRNDFRPGNLISIPRRKRRDEELRKLIEFDEDTFAKLKQLGRDRMATIQELADEAFADVLKKHGIPIDLRDALRKSAGVSKTGLSKTA